MKQFVLFFSFCLTVINLQAQKSQDFLKVIPDPTTIETAPEWAKMMYAEDPLVYEVIDLYNAYYAENTFKKTIHTQNFKRWARMADQNLDADGRVKQRSQQEENRLYKNLKSKKSASSQRVMNTWQSIGPFQTYKNGTTTPKSHHGNIYSIDQALYDDTKLICGSEGGGVYLTTDKGETWTLINKDEVFAGGNTSVALHPTDQDVFYVGSNRRLYKTEDGGDTWVENYFIDGNPDEIKFDPDNEDHMFLATPKGLFETTDGAVSWTQVFTDRIWDIDFHPTNSDIIYILKSNPALTKSEFLKSDDNGDTWTVITDGWYVPQVVADASESGGKIGVSADNPERVYAALIGNSKANDDGWIGIYRSDNAGESWTLPSGQIGSPYSAVNTMPWNAAAYTSGYHQGYYNFDLEVSPNDADLLWFGTVRLSESTDGGATYVSIGAANSTRLTEQHADIQAIHVSGEDVWVASDGGIDYSGDNLQSQSAKNFGISALQFWGFGAGWNEDVLVGGKYHNGNTAYHENYGVGYSHNVGGVEESTGYVNPLNNRNAYFNRYWAGHTQSLLIPDVLGGSTTAQTPINLIPNESYFTSYSSGIYHYPLYANQMLAGRDSIIHKSIDGGVSWDVLKDFGQGRVLEIEISRADNDVIYAVFQPVGGYWDWCEIHKTMDGGTTWTKLTDVPSNNRRRLQITTNPLDKDEIWVSTLYGANGQKIYNSTDGGTSWTNVTTNTLDDQNFVDIRYHGGSDGLVYIVSNSGFYYHQNGTWVDYSDGLPLVPRSLSLDLFYRDQKIRLSTGGRGIWEIDMPESFGPIAQAITQTDTLYCGRDTIQLESHSIVDQDNTAWNWSITPAPAFIDDNTKRNPKVLFSTSGDYDVTLTVTDGSGNSNVAVHENMFHLDNQCEIDTVQGLAMRADNVREYVQLPDFDITTNSFTVTAWVKPQGIQPAYTGILINDGTTAGLNFREANNTLGYHWPGGAWWWDSGLEVPADVWSHVALVATPTSLTVYLNGVGSTHNTSLDPVLLETMKIGSYKNWESRSYTGEIDEVAIWNRSLSQSEIRAHRHLTKENLTTDTDFIAYYQFNQGASTVLDKIGSRHGVINNDLTYEDCLAPLGSGVSEHHHIDAAGSYDFGVATAVLDLSSGGTYPGDEVYISRINAQPVPATNNQESLASYWIINNYGDENYTAGSTLSLDDPYTSPSVTATQDPSLISLITRPENDFTTTWTEYCTMSSVNTENYIFSNCNFGGEGQMFLLTKCMPDVFIMTDYSNGETEVIEGYNHIQANNTLYPNTNITYKAGQTITLLPSFEVKLGSVFTALIEDCSN